MADFDAEQLVSGILGWEQGVAADVPGQQWVFPLVIPDSTPPVISAMVPAAGSTISTMQPITFTVTDNGGAFRRVMVLAHFARTGIEEVVHDGDIFRGLYLTASARVAVENGFSFSVLRAGGWPSSPTIRIFAVDIAGNEAEG